MRREISRYDHLFFLYLSHFFFRLSRSGSQWFFISTCWVVLFWWLLIKYWKSLLCFIPYSDEYFSILTHWMLDSWMKWWNGFDMLVKVFMFFFLLLSCYPLIFFSSLSAYSRLQSPNCFSWSFKALNLEARIWVFNDDENGPFRFSPSFRS